MKQDPCQKTLLDTRPCPLIMTLMSYRVLIKAGVSIERLKRPVRRILNKLVVIYASYGYDLIITSTYEGTHSPSSLHYDDNAIDVDDPPEHKEDLTRKIKDSLGKDFDVILESDHIHIEYDPK